jgi:hypothetical protein
MYQSSPKPPQYNPGHFSTPGIRLGLFNSFTHLQPDHGQRQSPVVSSSEQDSRERPITGSSSISELCYDEDSLPDFWTGFTDLNLPDYGFEGYQRMFYQPMQNGSPNLGW